MFSSIFKFDMNLFMEYKELVDDLLKWCSIYFVFNFLQSYTNETSPFSNEYFQNMIYLIISLSFYHLVIKKAVKFV